MKRRPILAGCILTTLFLLSFARAQWIEGEIRFADSLGGLSRPGPILHNPGNNNVFVGGSSPNLLVLDGVSHRRIARIDLDDHARDLVYVPATNMVYVSTGSQVEVIDPAALRRVAVIPLEASVWYICFNRTANKLYGCSGGNNYVSVVDLATNTLASTIHLPRTVKTLCCNPVGNRVYCASSELDGAYVIDCATDSVVDSIQTGERPYEMLYSEAADRVYVTDYTGEYVSVIDAGADTLVCNISCAGRPEAIAQSADGAKVYVSDPEGDRLLVIDAFGDSVMARIAVGDSLVPYWLLYNSVDRTLYCNDRRYCYVIDGVEDSVLTVFAAPQPSGTAHNPLENQLYLTDDRQVIVLDCSTNRFVDSVWTSFESRLLARSTQSGRLYCTTQGLNARLAVFDLATHEVLSMVALPHDPSLILHEPASNRLLLVCEEYNDSNVVFFDCAANSIQTIATVPGVTSYAVAGVGARVYVVREDSAHDDVLVFDAASGGVAAVIPVVGETRGIGFNPSSNRVYVSGEPGSVSVIDAAADSVIALVPVPPDPRGYAHVSSRNLMCCFCFDCDVIVAIDSLNHADTVYVSGAPYGICYSPVTDHLYSSATRGLIEIIDCQTMERVGSVQLDTRSRLLLDSTASHIHASFLSGEGVYVFDCDGDSLQPAGEYRLPGRIKDALAIPEQRRFYYSIPERASIVFAKDSSAGGVFEQPGTQPIVPGRLLPTIVRSVIRLPESGNADSRFTLVNPVGRRVLDLHAGPNDISHLSPGVYFIHSPIAGRCSQPTTKVVIQR